MGSVSAEAGVSPEISELASIYAGGANFAARMAAMADLKSASERALADLNLATSAQQAMADAQQHLDAAQATHAQADTALSDARTQADGIIADAKAEAERLVAEAADVVTQANAIRQSAIDDTTKWKTDATAYAEKVTADADALRQAAQDDRQKASQVLEQHTLAHADMTAAKAKHDELAAVLTDKLDRLKAVLAELGA